MHPVRVALPAHLASPVRSGAGSAYAVEKLVECGELDAVARLHAQHYREMMTAAEAGWYTTPVSELMARFAPEIGNIHGALSRAFAPHGDPDIGVALTAASVPLWTLLSMFSQPMGQVGRQRLVGAR